MQLFKKKAKDEEAELKKQADKVAKAQENEAKSTGPESTPQKPKSTVKNGSKSSARSTQMHLKIAEIRDNVAVLKNGGLRAVIKTSSVNVHLKSEDEQNAIIYSYQNFLNALEFPIQILVRSKKLELDNYIDKLTNIAKKHKNPLMKEQTIDYIEYIKRLIEYADIMQKEFYVVVPYDPPRAKKVTFIQKFIEFMTPKDTAAQIHQRHREFEDLRKGLMQHVNIVKSGLANCSLKAEMLTTEELVGLFYEAYNPRTARLQKIKRSNDVDIVFDKNLHPKEESESEEDA